MGQAVLLPEYRQAKGWGLDRAVPSRQAAAHGSGGLVAGVPAVVWVRQSRLWLAANLVHYGLPLSRRHACRSAIHGEAWPGSIPAMRRRADRFIRPRLRSTPFRLAGSGAVRPPPAIHGQNAQHPCPA